MDRTAATDIDVMAARSVSATEIDIDEQARAGRLPAAEHGLLALGGHLGGCGRGCLDWIARRRHPLVVVALSAVIAVGVGVAVAHVAGVARVSYVLRHVEPTWFLACLAAEAVAYVGYVLALRETARVDGGPRLGLRHAAEIVAAGFGAFFSASASGGFKVDYLALRHAGALRKEALARVLGLGMLEYAVLAPAALGAALFIITGVGKQPDPGLTWPWLLVIPGILGAIWATHPTRRRRLTSGGGGPGSRAVGHAVAGLGIVRSLFVQPRKHGIAFVGTSLYWFGEITCLWAALKAFHANVPVPALILAFATGYVVTRRSLPAGGVGVAELFLTVALTWLGVPLPAALVGVFSYRIFNFWLALVPAVAVAPTVRELRAGIQQAERELLQERRAA